MSSQPAAMVTGDVAKRELARRELARRHVVDFSTYVQPWYKPARHHRLVGEMLEQVETYIRTGGKTGIGRLLVFEPPQHGKSEQVSKHFPAWLMGRLCAMQQMPCSVITTSYNADRAVENSRGVREILVSQEYCNIFGTNARFAEAVQLASDSRAVEKWDLAAPYRGGMLAAGVGGGVTGFGANLFIVDDPFKNREEAESESRRDYVWDWWTSSAYTRLRPNAAVVGMLTRWHNDDWAGRLIKQMANVPDADRWVVVNLPAIWEEPEVTDGMGFDEYRQQRMRDGVWVDDRDLLGRRAGEALWPESYPVTLLEARRANIGSYDWSALYQQNPYLRQGEFFRREWFAVTDVRPDPKTIVKRIRYWDKAGTKTGSGGDYAVGLLMSITNDDVVYIEHVARRQCTPMVREQMLLQTARDDANRLGPKTIIWHQQDPGSAGLDSAQATSRMLAKYGFTARFETVSGDKEVRAGPFSTACQGGHVRVLRDAWTQAYIDELVAFPKGSHDDQVDTSSGAYSKIFGRSRKAAKSYEG